MRTARAVTVIPPTITRDQCSVLQMRLKKRVAGYARVSTDGQSVDDDPKSSVHFSGCAGSGTNVMLDGGLVMFG